MTPEAILAAVSEAYVGFATYDDVGVVSQGAYQAVRFETRFQRGSSFHFAYTAFRPDGQKFHEGSVTVEDGRLSYSCSLGGPEPSSLRLGVAALTGISWGAAHGVPSLLIPEEIGGWLPTDLVRAVRLPDELVGGVSCFHVQGDHPKTPARYSLLVDPATFLIKRRVSHRDRAEVTDYESRQAA